MPERNTGKPEIAAQKTTIKLTPALGDWTTYKPPKILVKRVKSGLYGFDRLSREELKLALLVHYNFMEQLLKRLKIDLKMAVELFSVSVEQTTYLNFMRIITRPVVQAKVALAGLHDPAIFFFDLALANSIINYGLGSRDLEPTTQALTEAENKVFTTALTEYLPEYVKAFRQTINQPKIVACLSPDASIDTAINTSSTFVAFSCEVALADNSFGQITIGYLGNTIKKLLTLYKQKEPAPNFSRLHTALLEKIAVPLKVTLGETNLTANEINELEIGDVVSLDTSIKSPVVLKMGNLMKLLCQPGTKDKKLAARVAGLKEEQLELEPPPLEEELTEPKAAISELTEVAQPQPAEEEEGKTFAAETEEDFSEEDLFAEDDLADETSKDKTEDDLSDEDFMGDENFEDDLALDENSLDEDFPEDEKEEA